MALNCSKRKALRLHAERRARERYGETDPAIVQELRRIVKKQRKHFDRMGDGKIDPMQDQREVCAWRLTGVRPGWREQWRVNISDGRQFRVVYDPVLERIVTLLPLERGGE